MVSSTDRVTIRARDGGEFQAHLAQPAGGTGPGIVLMQEIFGINQYMRDVAAWYAARGFVVICPDLFWRQEPGVELTDRTDEEWRKAFGYMKGMDEGLAVEDCAATMAFLRAHASCTGKVAGVGFCLGGKLAYLLSARHEPDCCVGYYGVGIEKALAEAKDIHTPLMLHIAGKDEYGPPAAQAAIHEALDENSHVTLHDYLDQDHAFARPGGKHYDAEAAELANLRSVEFFVRHLAASPPPLSEIWDQHIAYEFSTRNAEDTLGTMVMDAYVNHVPVLTGGVGYGELKEFYSNRFIPKMPPDTEMTPVSRTIGADRLVDEMVFRFTHTIEMDWMLPGILPTGKRVEVPLVVIVRFRDGKLAHEHIYWDQACVLEQIGLLDAGSLPIAGGESARKVLNPEAVPSNILIQRAGKRVRRT